MTRPNDLKAARRNLDGLALAGEVLVQFVLCLGGGANQKLVEHVHRLIDGVTIALPEEADQRRATARLS